MKKSVFQVLNEINLADIENETSHLKVSNTLIQADLIKQGTKITMGAEHDCIKELMEEKCIVLLVIVNKEQYEKHSSQ